MNKADTFLEMDVTEELDWDPTLDNSQIVVKVNDGRVTLSGVVHTSFDSVRAREDAWRVEGVNAREHPRPVFVLATRRIERLTRGRSVDRPACPTTLSLRDQKLDGVLTPLLAARLSPTTIWEVPRRWTAEVVLSQPQDLGLI